jgi:hypothetical protein
VPSPLSVHLTTKYLAYYAGLATVSCVLAAPFLLSNIKNAYVALLLLALVATFALCAVVFDLGSRHEFEALQSFGVSLRRFAGPVWIAALCLQVPASIVAVAVAGGSHASFVYAVVSLASIGVAFGTIFTSVWRTRDAGVARACGFGCVAQIAFVAVALIAASIAARAAG